jgi:hypothetical protein
MANELDDQVDIEVDDAPEEIDVQIGEQAPEPKPDVVTMTPAEFAALKAQSDSAQAIQKGIEGLAQGLRQPTQAAQPANAQKQTPEEFYAEHADDMFDKEKAPAILATYNKMLMEREYGPMFNAQAAALVSAKKELLESREPLYKKYSVEVEQLVKSQPPNVQLDPEIYDKAWQVIRNKHSSEIENESVDAKVKAALDAKLKELGIDPEKITASNPRPPAYENSAARSTGGQANGKRTIRLPNKETEDKLRREAERRGLDFADYARSKGY